MQEIDMKELEKNRDNFLDRTSRNNATTIIEITEMSRNILEIAEKYNNVVKKYSELKQENKELKEKLRKK